MDVTIYDVARQAGVSPATVSRVLNGSGRVAAATRRRVEAAVAQLGYEPNRVARSLATSVTHTLALLLPDITNPFFPALVKGVQLLAEERRYTLLLGHTGADPEREEAYLRVLRGKRVDGVILVGLTLDGRRIRGALGEVPVVVLDRPVDLPGAAVVRVDHRGGALLAVRHLLQLGHRDIAHVAGPRHLAVARDRLEGYREALAEAGLPYRPELVVEADFTEEGGYAAVRRLCAAGPFTAVFAANDLSAIGVVAALRERGLAGGRAADRRRPGRRPAGRGLRGRAGGEGLDRAPGGRRIGGMRRRGVGFIGVGAVAELHRQALEGSRAGRLVAVWGPAPSDRERARAWGVRLRRGPRELVEDPEVEAVFVLSPLETHRELTLLALEAGKPVLVEKPVAASAAEVLELERRAAELGVPCVPGHN